MLCAKKIRAKLSDINQLKITLVDEKDYQLFTFNLYEVASAEEEFTTLKQLRKAITLPLADALKHEKIEFITGKVKEINLTAKTMYAAGKLLEFDYIVMAPGSESDFYNIEGASEFGLPLKSLKDALIVRSRIESVYAAHTLDMTKKSLRFVVAGGGYSGCELSAELSKLVKILNWKYNYPVGKAEVLVIEAMSELIPGFSRQMSRDAYERLKDLNINIKFSARINKVTQQFVQLDSGEKLAYDVLIWTVGVKARQLPVQENLQKDNKGRLVTNIFLQIPGYESVYVLGDAALAVDASGVVALQSAQDAISQAEYLSKAFAARFFNQKITPYKVLRHGFIVALGGRWAIMDYNGIYLKGFLAYFIREIAHIRYVAKLLGHLKAIKFIWFQNKIFGRND